MLHWMKYLTSMLVWCDMSSSRQFFEYMFFSPPAYIRVTSSRGDSNVLAVGSADTTEKKKIYYYYIKYFRNLLITWCKFRATPQGKKL